MGSRSTTFDAAGSADGVGGPRSLMFGCDARRLCTREKSLPSAASIAGHPMFSLIWKAMAARIDPTIS